MRILQWLFLSLFLLASLSAPSVADDSPTLTRIVERGELRVGMTGDQPPFNVVSKSGSLIGLDVDLAEVLAATMGVDAKLVTKPFAELLPALAAGEVDLVISGMTITPERNMKFAFVGPYVVSGKSILTKSSTLAAAEEAGDINMENVTVSALGGSTSQAFVEELLPKAKLMVAGDYEAAVQAVLDGTADAMVADMPICQLSTLRYPEAELITLEQPLTLEPIGIAMPNDPLLMNLLENYLRAMEGSGLLEALLARWFDDGSWLIQIP